MEGRIEVKARAVPSFVAPAASQDTSEINFITETLCWQVAASATDSGSDIDPEYALIGRGIGIGVAVMLLILIIVMLVYLIYRYRGFRC